MKFQGDIAFAPNRGNPPPPPEGYEIVPGYKFLYRIIIPECKLRTFKPCKCINKSPAMWCEYYDSVVTRSRCKTCGGKDARDS